MPRDHLDDGYHHSREYVEYAPSPRIFHAGPAYDDYTGRRTAFREQERYYGPPEEIVYAHPREGSHGSREYSAYPRSVRYYEDDRRSEYRYVNERPPRDASPSQGQSAADKFLAENEPPQPPPPPQPEVETPVPPQENEAGARYTPPPSDAPAPSEPNAPIRPLGPPHPRAPSTVSNSSRYDDYHPNGHRMPMSGPSGPPPRRPGPQRRRDRPYEHRGHSRYSRYMSVAREDPYGRGSSMSRSQSRRYEEQRRRLDEQETPQPNAEHDYEPDYSREHSIDQHGQDESYYSHPRRPLPGYVSVQDRMHPHVPAYSPPRYRYDEPRGPPSVYVDEYGRPIHEYEVIRVRGDPRQRGPYMPHQPHRYEQDAYGYVPVQYERPPPQRYNSRPEEYVYYEERERPLPTRPVQEAESDVYEPRATEIKVESVPVPMPPEAP